MYQKQCRLTKADKFFGPLMGGGGAPEIPQRDINAEWGDIQNLYGSSLNQYNQFRKDDPILSSLYDKAGNFETSPLLQQMQGDALSHLQTGGQLTPEEQRAVEQSTRAGFAARGNLMGNQALGTELLNSDIYSRQKYAEALGQASGVEQLGQSSTAQQFMLPESVVNTATGAYQGFINPLLQYVGDLSGDNQSAAADEAIAAANASAGNKSGMTQLGGAVIGAAGVAL